MILDFIFESTNYCLLSSSAAHKKTMNALKCTLHVNLKIIIKFHLGKWSEWTRNSSFAVWLRQVFAHHKVTKAEKITNVVYLRRRHRSSISSESSVDCWCTLSPGRVRRSTECSKQHGRRSPRGKRIKIVEGKKKTFLLFIYCIGRHTESRRVEEIFYYSSYPMILKSWQQVEVKWEKRRKQK